MPEEPVMTAAANFNTVIRPLAKSAPSTANIDSLFSYRETGTPYGLWGKFKDKAKLKIKNAKWKTKSERLFPIFEILIFHFAFFSRPR
jgi:hypothetical protein